MQSNWAAALDEFERCREAFYRTARRDLGLKGDIPTASWPPPWLDRLEADQRAAVVSATDPRPR